MKTLVNLWPEEYEKKHLEGDHVASYLLCSDVCLCISEEKAIWRKAGLSSDQNKERNGRQNLDSELNGGYQEENLPQFLKGAVKEQLKGQYFENEVATPELQRGNKLNLKELLLKQKKLKHLLKKQRQQIRSLEENLRRRNLRRG